MTAPPRDVRPPRRAREIAIGLGLAIALATGSARAEEPGGLFEWTSADGIVRYTLRPDRVPGSRRSTLLRVEPGMLRPTAPPPRPAKPAPPQTAAHLPSVDAAADPPEPSTETALEPAELQAVSAAVPLAESEPFNAPENRRRVEQEEIEGIAEFPVETVTAVAPARAGSPEPTAAPSQPEEIEVPAKLPVATVAAVAPVSAPAPVTDPVPGAGVPVAAQIPTASGAAVARDEAADPAPPAGADLDRQIRELEAAIARDEERFKQLISIPVGDAEEPAVESLELREAVARLPGLYAELRALEARRDPDPAPIR